MGFTSQLYPGEIIIDDSTPPPPPPPGMGRGLDLSQRPEGRAYAGLAEPFPANLIIPRSEWQARIQEHEERKTRVSDHVERAGLPHKDQASTNYCWINAPTYCLEIARVIQRQPMVILSPASAGAQIKNYRNVGGWGKEGLQWIVEHGLVPVSSWPANAIDKRYATPANKEIALLYRATEWWELEPRNYDEHISLLLHAMAAAVGLNYWSHEVTDEDAVWLDGAAWPRFRNSWKGWGANGYGVRMGSKAPADDIVVARVAIAA